MEIYQILNYRLSIPASTEERDVDSNRNITEETNSETLFHVEKPSSSFQKQKKKLIKPVNNQADKAFVDWLKTKKRNEDDPRKMFLLSLLPDIQSLSDEQMSAFRIKVSILLEEIKKPTSSVIQSQLHQYRDYSPISSVNFHTPLVPSTPSPINYSTDSQVFSGYSQPQVLTLTPINYSQNINDFEDFAIE
ncbi:unnamed protein product [Parnassius apollo]|uniref:(apollo) hypothetical protein n=1 Tax=Parnassius apollo TaxID=110799 RepID=A0A8S3XN38_PARAO|nr:unnamed protein product [Parnassius apollo]